MVAGFLAADQRILIWSVALLLVGGATVARTAVGVVRGRWASDIVAALAIIGALVFGEPLAGLIVVLMQTGGEALESWAEGRATNAVRALEDSAPRIAHIVDDAGAIHDVTVDRVAIGDRFLVRPGEAVPCDGVVAEGYAELDLSRITGEPLPERVVEGDTVRSGSVAMQRPVVIHATALASQSLYARIVELVREAQGAKAPLQRLADKWAVWFTPFTIVVCAVTWYVTRDTSRLLAVLVVATPCPLILAAPVAIIGGINRIARHRVIVRTGGALERLAAINAVALDKTGTLTVGHPEVSALRPAHGFSANDVLALAAAVERGSGHSMARSVVRKAALAELQVREARSVVEDAGRGVEGIVGEQRVTVGSPRWTSERVPAAAGASNGLPPALASETVASVTVDGVFAGTLVFEDAVRPGIAEFLDGLTRVGVTRTILISGDRGDRVAHVAAELGISDARGDLLPDEKVTAIRELVAQGHRVAMIGDGVNDAPALTAATVGIAIAAHGGGIAAQSADCVLLTDQLNLIPQAVSAAQRTLAIARQSVFAGLGLSVIAMGFASAGFLTPVVGALVQEAIDVAVILNAVRAAGPRGA